MPGLGQNSTYSSSISRTLQTASTGNISENNLRGRCILEKLIAIIGMLYIDAKLRESHKNFKLEAKSGRAAPDRLFGVMVSKVLQKSFVPECEEIQ